MTPRPPFWAIAIARRDSVTVSIAAERMGIFSPIPGASRVFRSVSEGCTFERAGRRRTSSNVRASGISRSFTMRIHTTTGKLFGPEAQPTAPAAPWHFLYFFPEPHGQGSFRPTFGPAAFTVATSKSPPAVGSNEPRNCRFWSCCFARFSRYEAARRDAVEPHAAATAGELSLIHI